MEHLPSDAVRTFFWTRAQLKGFEPEEHWQENHTLEAQAWLEEQEQKSLFMWLQEGAVRLTALSRRGEAEGKVQDRLPAPIRQGAVKEFMYFFKRDAGVIITAANLNEAVLFGCSRGDLLDSLLGMMNHVYVPVALADNGWPDNVRKDFTSQVQKFMSTVTEMSFQAKGQTVLYIPQDNFANLEAAAKDKDIVQRLEMALIHWTRQIKEVTTQQDSTTEGECNGPLNEIEFWQARDNNLSGLHEQLQSGKLQRILSILEHAKSDYLKHFKELEERIKSGSMEAKDNLKYLSFLKEPCEKLAVARPPEIPALLPQLLNYVRMIWQISEYYSSEERISSLLRTISNEIIRRCQATIELSDIFKGKVDGAMVQLQECIDCGRAWRTVYQNTVRLVAKYTDRPWTFQEGAIFPQIDAFVQRCCDLLEVCEGQQQFVTSAREGDPMQPIFGGTRAPETLKALGEIEKQFLKNLQRLENVDYDVLDVRAGKWQDDFTTFKNQIREMEVMYTNVINNAFDGVGTVQSAVEVLDGFFLLAKRERIEAHVSKKGEHLHMLLMQETNNIKSELDKFRKQTTQPTLLPIIQGHPTYAGTALAVKGLMLRLQRQVEELNLLCYLESSRDHDSSKEAYNNIHSSMEKVVTDTFNEWVQELKGMEAAVDLQKRLQVGLLSRPEETVHLMARTKQGMLESNFDKELLKMFQEVYYWEKIQGSGIVVPYAAHELASQRDMLRVTREHVLRVVRDYNQIIQALQPEERRLFNYHIRTLDRKIGPGITKYTWNNPSIKDFFVKESCRECAKVYEWVKQFKKNHAEIFSICKQVSEMHLIKIEKKTVHRDDEFRDVQEKRRAWVQTKFKEAHEKITELMLNSYQYFESHPSDIQREWKNYVEKIDKRIEEALKKAVKTSLQELCKALNGDNKTEPAPLFKIQAVLDETKMDFKPPMHQLKDLLQVVCRDMTMTLTVVPRLGEHLAEKKAERDRIRKQQLEEAGDIVAANAIQAEKSVQEPPKKREPKRSFYEVISSDEDCCIKYIKDVLKGLNNCAVRLGEKLKFWSSSYQPIVSQDKDTFIRRYKKTQRSLTIIGQDIQRYKEVNSEIEQENPKAIQDFIETDFTPLKTALMEHCQEWHHKLTDLLNEDARTEMNKLLEVFDNNTHTFHSEIKDMDELKKRIQLLDQCRKDDESMEDKIKPIEDKYAKLQEFEVTPPDDELARKAQMRPAMEKFRDTLVEAEMMINKEKKKMKAGLETDLTNFAQLIRDAKTEFQRRAPYKSEGITSDAAARRCFFCCSTRQLFGSLST